MKKVALITGGSRGIGLGIAHALADLGFDLAINGMRPASDVEATLDTLRQHGHKVIYCQGNIASLSDHAHILHAIKSDFGQLNLLVNNAGVAPKVRLDILQTTVESFDHVMNTNLRGPFFMTQSVANWMIEQKEKNYDFQAQIINISSISATVASTMRGEYCISKSGISMMTQLFAVRMAKHDIPVYEIRPGIIKSDMTAGVKEKYDTLIADGLTLQPRWGTPEDIGLAVKALANGAFPYSTGHVFMLDGGLTISKL